MADICITPLKVSYHANIHLVSLKYAIEIDFDTSILFYLFPLIIMVNFNGEFNLILGYVYLIFDSEKSVKALLASCTHDFCNGGDWYFKISSRRMRCKEVLRYMHCKIQL